LSSEMISRIGDGREEIVPWSAWSCCCESESAFIMGRCLGRGIRETRDARAIELRITKIQREERRGRQTVSGRIGYREEYDIICVDGGKGVL
jgi:hypothetical protein